MYIINQNGVCHKWNTEDDVIGHVWGIGHVCESYIFIIEDMSHNIFITEDMSDNIFIVEDMSSNLYDK
jgi:hypothetical protein